MSTRSVFITGGAGGIGLETAKAFAAAGWRVGLTDASARGLESASAQLPDDAFFAVADVCDATSLGGAMRAFADQGNGAIDTVVNNAGVLVDGDFTGIDLARQQSLIDVNVKGFSNCAHLAHAFLKESDAGCLVNLGSASSEHGVPRLAVYSASKFFVRGLSEALAIEWASEGIHVCEILPGLVQTTMTADATTPVFDPANVNVTPNAVAEAIVSAATERNVYKVRVDTPQGLRNRWLLRQLPHRWQQAVMRRITAA